MNTIEDLKALVQELSGKFQGFPSFTIKEVSRKLKDVFNRISKVAEYTGGVIHAGPTQETIDNNVAFLKELKSLIPNLESGTPTEHFLVSDINTGIEEEEFKTAIGFDYVEKHLLQSEVKTIVESGQLYNYSARFEFTNLSRSINGDKLSIIKSQIVDNISNGKFSEAYGISRVISYVIRNGFSPEDVGTRVANSVQEEINQLTNIDIQINTGAATLISLDSLTEDGELYWKLAQEKLGSTKKLRQKAFTTEKFNEIKSSIDGQSTTGFPNSVYSGNQKALDVLINDSSLKDKDIRTYQFVLYDELPSFGFWEFFSKPSKRPEELIRINLENKYVDFIIDILSDYRDDQQLSNTINGKFSKYFGPDFTQAIYASIAVDKELARRVELFNGLADASLLVDVAAGETLSDEEIKQIQINSAKAFAQSNVVAAQKPLTEEQIENRQRFYKQCALMLNIHRLSPKFEDVILDRQKPESQNFDGPDKNEPFGGRFWRAESDNTEQLMTNLVSSKDSSYMFEIPTHIMTQLTPKFRLYKVMNNQTGELEQTEFILPMYADIDRNKNFKRQQGTKQEPTIPTFLEAQFDKGDGVGLKSFSLDFNGTNPAEARNDVKGQMSLVFQSFADFTRTRVDPNGNEYRFVDLIIQPPADKSNRVDGIKIVSLRQYEPTFYRIRVDMGYNIPDNLEGISSTDLKSLKNAIRSMNKSFYLCMIDHNFNIKNDGTVEMNFTYRAYLETALKSLRFDALTTPELALRRIENENKLHDVAKSKKCTKDELRELQLAIAGVEQELIMNSLNSIMSRMYQRDKIFTVTIDNEDRKYFLKNGFYRTCDLINDASLNNSSTASSSGDLGVVLNSTFLSDTPDVDFERDINDTNIQFFFFGDLLHTILDALNDPRTKKTAIGLENTKIVLGSFEFNPYQGHGSAGKYNISNIPISVDFFGEWFKQNVLNQKSTRRTFPILNFIRNLSNHLVSNALLETCVNRNVDKAIRFQTGQISAISPDGTDPIGNLINVNPDEKILNTEKARGTGKLPLKGDVEGNSDIKNFYHYIVLSCNGSALTYSGAGKYKEDIEAGRFHVEIGSNRGIVKTVNFSKTDMQYLREARFFRNGIDGLLQLSSVYTATVEMFGNTLFYPGMDLWINPYGFGGTHLGSPTQGDGGTKKISNRSLANILGIGGYHTITAVTTTLTPQSFVTSIKSQHYYSGDKENPDSTALKGTDESGEGDLIEMGVPADSRDSAAADYCKTEILEQINFDVTGTRVSNSSPAPRIEATPSASTAASTTTAAEATTETEEEELDRYFPYRKIARENGYDIVSARQFSSGDSYSLVERNGSKGFYTTGDQLSRWISKNIPGLEYLENMSKKGRRSLWFVPIKDPEKGIVGDPYKVEN